MESTLSHIGLYPGTFDPITHGHMDVIRRAARVLDKLVIGVAENQSKGPLFDIDTRVTMVKREVAALGRNIEVHSFSNLLVHFAKDVGASVIIRGLRNGSDFDYEFTMAAMNHSMAPDIETIFLSASEDVQAVASTFVRQIASLGGDVSPFVSPATALDLKRRFQKQNGPN